MRITVISGGLAGARVVRGLLDRTGPADPAEVTVVANTGDDISLWGLRLSPDVDELLAGLRADGAGTTPSSTVSAELTDLGVGPQWYPVSDRDVATHIARTAWLGQGATPTEVLQRLAEQRGLTEHGVRLLPMSDVPVETHVVLDDDEGQHAVHVQQWRHELASPPAARFIVAGMDRASAAPGVLDAIREADVVLLPAADPVLSIGIVLGVPGVRDALRGTSAPVIGISPDPGTLGPSLAAVDVEPTSAAVAGLYRDLLDGWLTGPSDAPAPGARWRTAHTDLTAPPAEVATAALDLAASLR